MEALNLMQQARSAGLLLRAEGEQLVIRGPASAEPLVSQLLENKVEVLAVLRGQGRTGKTTSGVVSEKEAKALASLRPHLPRPLRELPDGTLALLVAWTIGVAAQKGVLGEFLREAFYDPSRPS